MISTTHFKTPHKHIRELLKVDGLSLSYLSYCNRQRRWNEWKKNCVLLDMENVQRPLGSGKEIFHGIYGALATSHNGGHNNRKKCIRLKPRRISEVLRMKNVFSNRLFRFVFVFLHVAGIKRIIFYDESFLVSVSFFLKIQQKCIEKLLKILWGLRRIGLNDVLSLWFKVEMRYETIRGRLQFFIFFSSNPSLSSLANGSFFATVVFSS